MKVGRYLSVQWPIGVGLSGNAAISNYVKKAPGAIGYVELIYALQNQLTLATIRNAKGAYIRASADSITAAPATANTPEDFAALMPVETPDGKGCRGNSVTRT